MRGPADEMTTRAVKLFKAPAAILSVQGHIYFLAELFSTRQFFLIRNLYAEGMGLGIYSYGSSMLMHN
jgi:hypothetical protein